MLMMQQCPQNLIIITFFALKIFWRTSESFLGLYALVCNERVANMGFAPVKKLTILGLEIDNKGYIVENCQTVTKNSLTRCAPGVGLTSPPIHGQVTN
jgi:hypothetical protein